MNQVIDWEYRDLENWLRDPSCQESWDYDFKLRIPDSRNNKGKDRLRHVFCSFANSKRGLVFFGISDDKSIIGLSYDHNFQTKVSNIVSSKILLPIRNWSLFHTIKIPNKEKHIYIVQVSESFYTDKPHMTDGRAYIRENGHCKPIENGLELRRTFLLEDNFYPEYIRPVQDILGRLKKSYDAHLPLLDTIIFHNLRLYLEAGCIDEARMHDYRRLLNLFQKIEALLPKVKKSFGASISGGKDEYRDNYRELSRTIDEFSNELSRIL